MTAKISYTIRRGETFSRAMRWAQSRKGFADIDDGGITQTAPVRILASNHGLLDGWPVFISGVRGLNPERPYPVVIISDDEIMIRENIASDQARRPYVTGGVVMHYLPVDLSGYTARMQFRAHADADETIVDLTTENGGITLNPDECTVAFGLEPEQTELFEPYSGGVYDLEMVASSGDVFTLAAGRYEVEQEVTR